jgi:hypothetical protein
MDTIKHGHIVVLKRSISLPLDIEYLLFDFSAPKVVDSSLGSYNRRKCNSQKQAQGTASDQKRIYRGQTGIPTRQISGIRMSEFAERKHRRDLSEL